MKIGDGVISGGIILKSLIKIDIYVQIPARLEIQVRKCKDTSEHHHGERWAGNLKLISERTVTVDRDCMHHILAGSVDKCAHLEIVAAYTFVESVNTPFDNGLAPLNRGGIVAGWSVLAVRADGLAMCTGLVAFVPSSRRPNISQPLR